MPDERDDDGDIMAGDRRLARADSALPDWEMPDASYRPVPIVWFMGAMVVQYLALPVIYLIFQSKHALFTIGLSALASAMIGSWTWQRGMVRASAGWKIATVVCLGIGVAMVALLAAPRL